jgi:anaerobic magnesium-protoporphyrin IX monomethyl ester cyclase
MNVLLLAPYTGAIFEGAGIRMQPLGLSYIGAALKRAGHEVQIEALYDRDAQPDYTDADVVGISCTTFQFKQGLKLAKTAKAAGKTVVMGGPHPTSRPEESLQSGYVDFAARAEGEMTMLDLLDVLPAGRNEDLRKIPGLSWMDGETGRVVHNPDRSFVSDLDKLPFPLRNRNKLDKSTPGLDGLSYYPVITTRGCPYGCKFCDVHLLAGRRFRMRSIANVVDEIETLKTEHDVRRIAIVDDIINFDANRLMSFCDEIIKRRLSVTLWVMGRTDLLVQHPETAGKMAEAGVRTMFLGIESPNKRVLDAYKKGGKASSQVSNRAVDLLRNAGIETWGAFILGEPSETRQEIEETIHYAESLNPGMAQFTILTPYPSTELWHELKSRLITMDWDRYDAMHAVFKPDHLSPQEVEELCRKAYRKFYLKPARIARAVLGGRRFGRPDLKMVARIIESLNLVFPRERKDEDARI